MKIFISIFLFSSVVFGFTEDAWIDLEDGKILLESKEYGKALNLFQKALDKKKGIYPEAEALIGDVFFYEGEYKLAIYYYNRALKYQNAFNIPKEKYEVLYKLANIYYIKKDFKNMSIELQKIVSDSALFKNYDYESIKTKILNVYLSKGIDQVLKLYRFKENFSIDAFNQLGWFYYSSGRYRSAISSFLFSVISSFSTLIDFLKNKNPDYSFDNIYSLLSISLSIKDTKDYIYRVNLFGALYQLAVSSFAHNNIDVARQIWKVISRFREAGQYQSLSRRQLKNPWKEPTIDKLIRRY